MKKKTVTLEVIPPLEAQISDAEKVLTKLMGTVRKSGLDLLYSVIGTGVYLLKVRGLRCQQGARTDLEGTSGHESAGDEEAGFYTFLEEKFCRKDIKDEAEYRRHVEAVQRTARRYMNAARNAGLTGDHTLADVKKMRAKHALDDKSLTDLYKALPAPDENSTGCDPAHEHNLALEINAEVNRLCSQMLSLRDQTKPEIYEANVTTLRSTLEAYTGAKWDMAGTGDGEHGEVTEIAKEAKARWKKQQVKKGRK